MRPIYLDYQATTPVDPCVVDAMQPYWTEDFGNPHSEGHSYGWNGRQAVERARAQVAEFIGADDDEIIFTSGATESCNIALRGTANSGPLTVRRQVITVTTEHPAVLETVHWLSSQGYEVKLLPVKLDGLLDLHVLETALSCQTLIVSVMLANNEIGVIQPVKEISELCHSVGALLHTDATQAAGRIRIDVNDLGVDLLSLSGHKIYGPNGIGALYVRNRSALKLMPIMTGGSQEKGIRPGTVPVPLAVGMGVACAIANEQMEDDVTRITNMGQQLLQELKMAFPDLLMFGHPEQRIPGNLNLGLPNVIGETVVQAISGEVAISTGAACSSGSSEPSHVLTALGLDPEVAATAVRISLGRFTTEDEMRAASGYLRQTLKYLSRGV